MGSAWRPAKTWSPADQQDFNRHIARVRPDARGQDIFIQGYTLSEQGVEYCSAAIALFDQVITQHPTSLHLVPALSSKAACLEKLGQFEDALGHYLQAVEAFRKGPAIEAWAWLDFAWLVARRRISARYGVALSLLDEFGARGGLILPNISFRLYGSRALILNAQGSGDAGAEAARTALEAARRQTSGLPRHPDVGLVGPEDLAVLPRLEKIASRRGAPGVLKQLVAGLIAPWTRKL